MSRIFWRIAGQSSTQSATSWSPTRTRSSNCFNSAGSLIRSTSACITDSALPFALSSSARLSRWPPWSRPMKYTGWIRLCSSRFDCCAAMPTESTRNRMSAVATCTTVYVDSQPCSSSVGLNTRTTGAPAGRVRVKSSSPRSSAVQVAGVRTAISSSETRLKNWLTKTRACWFCAAERCGCSSARIASTVVAEDSSFAFMAMRISVCAPARARNANYKAI